MRTRHSLIAVSLFAAFAHAPALARPLAVQQLLEQGQYWASRGNDERATEAWNRALRSEPDLPEALYGLAIIEVGNKRLKPARTLLERLRRAHPDTPLVARLEQDITLRDGDAPKQLDAARAFLQSGDPDRAVAQYRLALGGKAPLGKLALEFYQTLGYTSAGWDEARMGLDQLAHQSPDNHQVELALAQLLVNRESTRKAGIRQLQRLSARSDVGGSAKETWRQALNWMGTPLAAADAAMVREYLKAYPDDAELQAKLTVKAAVQTPARSVARAAIDTRGERVAAGFRAIDANDLLLAEKHLQAVLAAHAQDADALGGMGVIRLRQERLAEARDLLQHAQRRAPDARWGQVLDTADTLLGNMQAQQGSWAAAEASFRSVLARRPEDADATLGLIGVLSQNGKADDALRLAEGLPANQQAKVGNLGTLRARKALAVAKKAGERGDDAGARAALQDALQLSPNDPWLRLTLARMYLKDGATDTARGLVDALLVSHPDMPDALYASALIDADTREWQRASTLLERIPPARRTAAITALHRRANVYLLTDNASRLASQQRHQDAYAQLAQAEAIAGNDGELTGVIASSYADLGDNPRALGVMRHAVARSGTRDVDLQLSYAGLLLRTLQDVELAGVLRQLQTLPMTAAQMQAFEDLRSVYEIRQADTLRGQGDIAGAYDVIKPMLLARPDDAAVVAALARMYADAGDAPKAQQLYTRLLRDTPDSIEALLGSATAAVLAKDAAHADAMLNRALKLAPANADVLTTAARIYRSQGRTARAEQLLKAAIALQPPASAAQVVSSQQLAAAAPAVSDDNPFVRSAGMRPRSTALPVMQIATDPALAGRAVGQRMSGSPPATISSPLISTPLMSAPLMSGSPTSPTGVPLGAAPQNTIVAPVHPMPSASPATPVASTAPTAIDMRSHRRILEDELSDIQQLRSPAVTVGGSIRTRKGEEGMSQLSDVKVPVEFSFPVGDGKASIRLTPVTVSAGSLGAAAVTNSRFGGGPVAAAAQAAGTVGTAGAQRQTGTGLAFAYAKGIVDADIGTTPLGFEHSRLVGGIKLQGALTHVISNQFELSRRAVTDSVLSFAGTRDDRTGQSWGGVTATGARYLIGADRGGAGIYGSIGYASLNGSHVVSNTRFESGVGVYSHLINTPGTRLTTGLNLSTLAFDKNLRHFTVGHGGYFSPQRFVALSVPLTWAQTQDRFSYQVGGSLGVQHVKEDRADYFPGDAAAQAAAATAAGNMGLGSATYTGQRKTGVGYNLAAAMEYRLTPRWVAGGHVGLDNASDYRQFMGKVYLRYRLQSATGPLPLPVAPFRSPYGD